jgi:hypothetical protein
MYVLYDRPVVDTSTTKQVNLMVAQPDPQFGLAWHTLRRIDLGVIGGMFVDLDEVFMFGTQYNTNLATAAQVPYLFSLAIPTQHGNPMKEATVNVEDQGTKTFVTAIMDFAEQGYQHDDKGWLKVEVTAENVDANLTIVVEEQKDHTISDSGAWTSVGTINNTNITNNQATVGFAAATAAKRLRLRFTLATNVTTSGPIIREFRVFAVPSPERYWTWDMTCRIATDEETLTGATEGETAQNTLTALVDTLDAEDYPLKFNDIDNVQYNVRIAGMQKVVLPQDIQAVASADAEHLEYGIRLRLREYKTS